MVTKYQSKSLYNPCSREYLEKYLFAIVANFCSLVTVCEEIRPEYFWSCMGGDFVITSSRILLLSGRPLLSIITPLSLRLVHAVNASLFDITVFIIISGLFF